MAKEKEMRKPEKVKFSIVFVDLILLFSKVKQLESVKMHYNSYREYGKIEYRMFCRVGNGNCIVAHLHGIDRVIELVNALLPIAMKNNKNDEQPLNTNDPWNKLKFEVYKRETFQKYLTVV